MTMMLGSIPEVPAVACADRWPIISLYIGGEFYSQVELLELLRTETAGDASLVLARELIEATLQVIAGVHVDELTSQALAVGEAWMLSNKGSCDRLPYRTPAGSRAQQTAAAIAGVLSHFNDGGW